MTQLVGILNHTPDSFSDGGRFAAVDAALAHIEQLIEDGASVIDIGAESTRPGATPLSGEEEWARLEALFSGLTPGLMHRAQFSLDTRHAKNAKRALDKGFHWINDVSGFLQSEMIDTVMGYNCKLVVMHSLSVPADKNITLPEGSDVIRTLMEFAQMQCGRLQQSDIACERIIIDPGLGFGKNAMQNWQIIERISELQQLGLPLLVGHSRKSFLRVEGESVDAATFAVSKQLIAAKVDYLRVHDVAAHRALLGESHG